MKLILNLVILTTCFLSTSIGEPQLFPFSSLRNYFDHHTRNGPGNDKSALVPELTTAVETSVVPQPSKVDEVPIETDSSSSASVKYSKIQLPPNHKPDISPNLEPPSAKATVSPAVKYHPPIPEQVLKAPDAISPILYGTISPQDKSKEQLRSPQGSTFLPQVPTIVGEKKYDVFGGFVPSHTLQSPPPPPESHNKPTLLLSPKIPLPNVQTPKVAFTYPKEEVTKENQDLAELSKQDDIMKIAKAPNHLYPKKWQPERKESNKKRTGKENVASSNKLNEDVGQDKKTVKEREPQFIPAALEAASSFQKKKLPLFPIRAAPKVPSLDEQIASETGFTGITAGVGGYDVGGGSGGGGGQRVEFQMHGQHGPHSYKFGYDTGKGHNRQFRYEERDTHGHVKGHYGFYDKHGKLQIVSYSAHPEHGFQADGNFGKHGIA